MPALIRRQVKARISPSSAVRGDSRQGPDLFAYNEVEMDQNKAEIGDAPYRAAVQRSGETRQR